MPWSISAVWDNGEEEQILDIPDDVSQPIDNWLTEVEEQQLEIQFSWLLYNYY
jgi:hypothetical protein